MIQEEDYFFADGGYMILANNRIGQAQYLARRLLLGKSTHQYTPQVSYCGLQ